MSLRKSPDLQSAQVDFRLKGWTYRTASARLGVHHAHLYRVISGQRESRTLLARIVSLPRNPSTGSKRKPRKS